MKDILLKIVGRQINRHDVEDDAIEFITEGKFYEKGNSVYLLYEESELSGMEGVTTSLKITGDKIRMKRFGDDIVIDTVIEFEKGKRFTGFYDTPFGSFEMEVMTNSIENNIDKMKIKGHLDIDYNISLKGVSEGRSLLNIQIM